jgi:glycosyltransferase involved in cell wall biosynthesis
LATFASDVYASLGDPRNGIIAVDDVEREFCPDVKLWIDKNERRDYALAASAISDVYDVVNIQHEYGIYGGYDGAYLLDLVANLTIPAVATLHTVLRRPTVTQRDVLTRLCEMCARVVVMSDRASDILEAAYGVSCHKIDVIPHGVPDSDDVAPAPEMRALKNDPKLFTFGLLSPGKGIEVAIDGVAIIKEKHPNVRYVVLGATHPDLKKREGEAYRDSLVARARSLGISENVIFIDEYTTLERLCGFLAGADIYITPYLDPEQICSGTLSYATGFGLPVVSTPFIYAQELVEKGGGLLFPFGDSNRMAELVMRLIEDPAFTARIRNSASMIGRTMRWPVVGSRLNETLAMAVSQPVPRGSGASRALAL